MKSSVKFHTITQFFNAENFFTPVIIFPVLVCMFSCQSEMSGEIKIDFCPVQREDFCGWLQGSEISPEFQKILTFYFQITRFFIFFFSVWFSSFHQDNLLLLMKDVMKQSSHGMYLFTQLELKKKKQSIPSLIQFWFVVFTV